MKNGELITRAEILLRSITSSNTSTPSEQTLEKDEFLTQKKTIHSMTFPSDEINPVFIRD